jgi:uncharacterized protein
LRDGQLLALDSVGSDEEIIALAAAYGRSTVVSINAPLGLPGGRCCLEDDCACRHDPGTRSRLCERELARERIPTLATALIKVLARRGITLSAKLREAGYLVLEAYPFATLRALGLPARGKRSRDGRRMIAEALKALVPGLDHPDASEHELDAVVCALTADLWLRCRCRMIGDPTEGQMAVPYREDLLYAVERPPARRAAERQTTYSPAIDS